MRKTNRKQSRHYGVYYVGAPYSVDEELEHESDVLQHCREYLVQHAARLYGSNSAIRDLSGQRVF